MARILLADDDQGSLDMVRRALEMDGHSVVTAEDGNEALAKLGTGADFDVLVTDVQMPGLDGISLAGKAIKVAPTLRLVMMSGYPDILDQARGLGAKKLRLIAKPFTIDKIRAEVKAALAP